MGYIKTFCTWTMKLLRSMNAVVLAYLLVGGGVLLYGVSFLPDVSGNFRDFARVVGGIILAGGAFSAVAKGIQYSGIIQDELAKIIYSEDFLKKRVDLEDIWGTITGLIYGNPYPRLKERIYQGVINGILRNDSDYYYTDAIHTYTLKWKDRRNSIIVIEHSLQTTFVPRQGVSKIEWEPEFVGDDPAIVPNTQRPIEILELSCGDNSYLGKYTVVTKNYPGLGAGKTVYVYNAQLTLEGPSPYVCVWTTEQNLNDDNALIFQATKYCDGVTVQCYYEGSSMNVEFVPIGDTKDAFRPAGPQDPERGILSMKHTGLLMLNQGFMIDIRKSRK